MYFVDIVGDNDDVQSSRSVSGGATPIVKVSDYTDSDYTEPLHGEPAEPEEGNENLRPPSSDTRIRSTVLVSTGESWNLEFCLYSFVVT